MLGAQILVLLFKYYLPSNVLTGTTAPNTLDFGSYYMGDVNLTSDETFKTHEKDSKTTLYGFNPSLDSIRNLDNAVKSGSIVKDEIDQHIIFNVPEANYLASHAFDGNVSAYTNIGVPLGVEEVVIPETYENIESYAFAGNPMTIGLKTLKLNPSAIQNQYCKIHEYAFSELLSLNKIDLSAFPVTFAETVMTDDTLKTI
ncbi:MAG: leucine-rich repeat domain-containing protein [Mycoplasmoidaceae bacterium]|nr:leucine-rich repeat domain-containing protein [Mycoplasmoidaceae bacterium]